MAGFTVARQIKCKRLLKRQSHFDHVIVFDEGFESNTGESQWLTFVDFCSTYKYDPVDQCLKTAT